LPFLFSTTEAKFLLSFYLDMDFGAFDNENLTALLTAPR